MNNKLYFLDIAKGIGILFVVIGHFSFFDYHDPVLAGIYSFHMPLFFLISGYLINFEKYSNSSFKFIENRFFGIIKPYLIFSIISFIFWGIVNNSFPYKFILGILYGNGVNGWLDFNLPLWFLPAIFFANIIFFFSQSFLSNELTRSTTSLALSILGCYLGRENIILPLGIDIALMVQVFFYFGILLKKNKFFFNKPLLAITLLIPIQIAIVYFNGRIDINGRYFNNIALFYAGGILGSLIILSFARILEKFKYINNLFAFLGRNSLYIMAYHVFGFAILNMAEGYLNKELIVSLKEYTLFYFLYTLIGSIALSLLASSLHERIKK